MPWELFIGGIDHICYRVDSSGLQCCKLCTIPTHKWTDWTDMHVWNSRGDRRARTAGHLLVREGRRKVM